MTQDTQRKEIRRIKLRMLASVGAVLFFLGILGASAAPTIVVQPASQMGAIFGSAIFSVTASNNLPLNYQWDFNGAAIANATNSALILSPLGYAESGTYSVIVSNAFEQHRDFALSSKQQFD